jgi:hypothetical protein
MAPPLKITAQLDLQIFISHWLEADCTAPDWCDGTDMNESGTVNFADYAILATYLTQEN